MRTIHLLWLVPSLHQLRIVLFPNEQYTRMEDFYELFICCVVLKKVYMEKMFSLFTDILDGNGCEAVQ